MDFPQGNIVVVTLMRIVACTILPILLYPPYTSDDASITGSRTTLLVLEVYRPSFK